MRQWLPGLFTLFVTALLAAGCGSCRTRGQDPIEFHGGEANLDTLTYQTGPASGEYLHFPPGRTYDLMHELGIAPDEVLSWVSYRRVIRDEDDDPDTPGNYAESAGNQVVVECQDEERVRVRNDTCADLYLRVKLKATEGLSQDVVPCP